MSRRSSTMMLFHGSLVACATAQSLANAADFLLGEASVSYITIAIEESFRMLFDETLFDAFGEALYTLVAFAAATCIGGLLRKDWRRPPAAGNSRKNSRPPVTRATATVRAAPAGKAPAPGAPPACAAPKAAIRKFSPHRGGGSSENVDEPTQALTDGRAPRPAQAETQSRPPPIAAQQLVSYMRTLASRHRFKEALQAYDAMSEKVGAGCGTTWSLLLYCSVEAGDFRRCEEFFSRLCAFQVPSNHDFVNMARYCVYCGGSQGLFRLLHEVKNNSGANGIDVIARNRALAVCVSRQALDLAELLIIELPHLPMDVVGYNTLMKGYMQACQYQRCFDLYAQMQEQGVKCSEMTFGIMLDASVGSRSYAVLKQVFRDLKTADLQLNVVHYTTFIKGLVSVGCVSDAMQVLEEMNSKVDVKPDLVTYTTLVKAHSDSGDVMSALGVLEQMLDNGIVPDGIVYNILLTGCCVKPMEPMQVLLVINRVVRHGFKPSITTFSILVKVFARTRSWQEILTLLEMSHKRFGIWPEPRIYAQLAQACANSGNGREALEAYAAMVRCAAHRSIAVDRAANNRILRLCVSCDEGVAARLIFDAVTSAGGRASTEAIDRIMRQTERREADA